MAVASGFEPLEELLQGFVEATPGYSAQLCVIQGGHTIVDIAVGDISPEQHSGVFSCSKGAAASVIALLLQRGQLRLNAPVAEYWPEFAAAGKENVTVHELLSHRAGLMGIDGGAPMGEYLDSSVVAQKLANMPRMWAGNSLFAYHSLTMGVFMEELVRRVTGERLQEIYEREVRAVHELDFYLGLPAELENRFVPVRHPLNAMPEVFVDPFGLQGVGANSVTGFLDNEGQQTFDLFSVPNVRAIRESGFSAVGGVANARGLASLYEAFPNMIQPETLAEMTTLATSGLDVSNGEPGAFATVFTKPRLGNDFGSWRAFGHNGLNGSVGYADPSYQLAVGYLPLHAEGVGTGSRSDQISKLLRQLILRNAST